MLAQQRNQIPSTFMSVVRLEPLLDGDAQRRHVERHQEAYCVVICGRLQVSAQRLAENWLRLDERLTTND